jgi:hypothetical protein
LNQEVFMSNRQLADRDAYRNMHIPDASPPADEDRCMYRALDHAADVASPEIGSFLRKAQAYGLIATPGAHAAISAIQDRLTRAAGAHSPSEDAEQWMTVRGSVSTGSGIKSPPVSIEDRLREARAERELQRLRETRIVVEAAEKNLTQRTIADLLGRSQSDVFRMLKAARARQAAVGESVREIILNYVVRDISRGELLGRLTDLQHGTNEGPDFSDGYQHGAFDDVKVAWLDGLIDDELYEEIRQGSPRPSDQARHRAEAEQ